MSYSIKFHDRRRSDTPTKARKTFSLSQENLEFLETVRRRQKAASLTAALEMILEQEKQRREVSQLDSTISQYYDSLSDEEVEEQRNWGEFAGKGLRRKSK